METVELFAWRRLHECAARSQRVGRRTAWTTPNTPGSGAASAGREGLLGTCARFLACLRGTLGFRLPCRGRRTRSTRLCASGGWILQVGVGMIRLGDVHCLSLVCLLVGRHDSPTSRATRPAECR